MMRAPVATSIVAGVSAGSPIATYLLQAKSNHGLTQPTVQDDGYIVVLALEDCGSRSLWADGKPVPSMPFEEASLCIYDLSRSWVAEIGDPFRSMHFYVPRPAIDDVEMPTGRRASAHIRCDPGAKQKDLIAFHLCQVLLQAMARPHEANGLFLDQVGRALAHHLVATYGDGGDAPVLPTGGLSAWQVRRTTEFIDGHLGGAFAVSDLARECGLSTRHFTRAFSRSMGDPPHRWLMKRRVAKAQDLLLNSPLALAEIADVCGFADQSHLSRVFSAAMGVSPAIWRRQHRVRRFET